MVPETTDVRKAAASDVLADALDYSAVAETIAAVLRGGKFRLIETAAERVAGRLLADFRLSWLRLELRKPIAAGGYTAVITVESTRGASRSRGTAGCSAVLACSSGFGKRAGQWCPKAGCILAVRIRPFSRWVKTPPWASRVRKGVPSWRASSVAHLRIRGDSAVVQVRGEPEHGSTDGGDASAPPYDPYRQVAANRGRDQDRERGTGWP